MSTETNIAGTQYFIRVIIDGVDVTTKNIQSVSLREFIFDTACELDLSFMDTGYFVEEAPIVDGTKIRIVLAKDNSELPIDIEFQCLNSRVTKNMSSGNTLYLIDLVAITNSDYMFSNISQRVLQGTSNQVIGQVVSENKQLTYVEEVESNDYQSWFQISINDSSFIKNVINRAYYQSEDMPIIFCNKYNRFVYTTLKTRAEQKTKFIAINNDFLSMDSGNQDPVIDSIIKQTKSTNTIFFRSDYTFTDNMPIANRQGGYGFDYTYFDGNNFNNMSINFNYAPFTKYINKKQHEKKYASLTYNIQNSNVHPNYLLAYNQNMYLMKNMFSSFVTMSVSPNLQIDLMDKVNVSFLKQIDPEINKVGIDDIHSGEYLVGGIYHNIRVGGKYSMILVLFRNGFNIKENPKTTVNLIKA